MSEAAHTDEHQEHAEHHIVPPRFYVLNAIAITILMALTVIAGKWDVLNFGNPNGLNLVIALLIAMAKTACIGAVFMGVWWNSPLVKVFALGVIAWIIIFFAFTLVDYINPEYGLDTPYTDFHHQGESPLPK
jgi:caa(3)-type oxidase subunit IV